MRSECGLRAEVNELAILKWEKRTLWYLQQISNTVLVFLQRPHRQTDLTCEEEDDCRRIRIQAGDDYRERREEGLQLNFPGDSLENKS